MHPKAIQIDKRSEYYVNNGMITREMQALACDVQRVSGRSIDEILIAYGFITEYESFIGSKLIHIMTGGNISKPAWLDEQYFLDLEREAFLSLCGEKKSQERMWAILQTGKPLRN